ncbi:MAG: homoserine O-succinyltransferase [Deltaproteobacteria bacterium]|nr:homoserine O-succinyltransferase [Deltaproteobacteria bacterium]
MLTVENWSKAPESTTRHRLVIGLVNNMPDGALHNTERQFGGLLQAASHNISTRLRYFSLPGLHRGADAQAYINRSYEDINQLWSGRLDGLIVTGTEPRASLLQDEPYWGVLKDLIDQVHERAIPTIWSCLAAHAAALHLDGIHRRPLREKLSGVFECRRVIDHQILANGPSRWCVPHSRQNELPEEQLITKGYRILSKSPEVGADMFIREDKVLFIFLQGHLEYDPDTLFREYRRDVRRFLVGERDYYPAMPRGYFDPKTAAALVTFQEQAMRQRRPEVLLQLPENSVKVTWAWRDLALHMYANWLAHIVRLRS